MSYDHVREKLPVCLRKRIERYYQETDRKLGVLGKMLLINLLNKYKLSEVLFLTELQVNEFGRPFFDYSFDFNISHSGKIAVCAASSTCTVGIDIEEVKNIDFEIFDRQFSCTEWDLIKNDKNSQGRFFELWTRKEALIKAIGSNIGILHEIEVINDIVMYKNRCYRIESVYIDDRYKAAIVYSGDETKIITERLDPKNPI
jgi:4'-phosphopantetheinyl transferase